jgi:acetyltransferase-like isoleucine patch superfamily enzyme
MARLVFAALASLFLSQHASAVNGQITNLDLAVKFGTAPGLDFFDASGNYVQGSGNNGISLPSEAVVLSFDNGKFIQALPSNSFTAISGGWRYTAPAGSSGITLFKIMNNGTFDIDVRKSDFTGSKSTAMGPFTITIGDDVWFGQEIYVTDANHGFSDLSVPFGRQLGPHDPVTIGDGTWIGHGAVILPCP